MHANVNDVTVDGRIGDETKTFSWLAESIVEVIEVPVIIDVDEAVGMGVVLFEVTSVCDANANNGLPMT